MTVMFEIVPAVFLVGISSVFILVLLVDSKMNFDYFSKLNDVLPWLQNGDESSTSSDIEINKSADDVEDFMNNGNKKRFSDIDFNTIDILKDRHRSSVSIKHAVDETDINRIFNSDEHIRRDLIENMSYVQSSHELDTESFIELSKQWQFVLERARIDIVREIARFTSLITHKEMEKQKHYLEAKYNDEKAKEAIELTIPKVEYEYNGMDGLPPPDISENIEKARTFSSTANEERNKAQDCERDSEALKERLEKLKYQLRSLNRESGMWQKLENDIREHRSDTFVKRIAIKTCLILVLLCVAMFIIRH